MSKAKRGWGLGIVGLVLLIISANYLTKVNIPILQPQGIIADQEFRLILIITGIMMIVAIPVFILLGYIIWRYRDTNLKPAKYTPDWDSNRLIEGLWWLIPSVIVAVLSVITWNASYALNPYKPIASLNKPINVQVIALDWKWLFIYPQQNVASVNQVVFPANTPVHFYLTSDTVMNSFWIPQLSGQIYNMPGMQTQLYIMASHQGSYKGWSANISGIGFASMMFSAQSTSNSNFRAWIKRIQHNSTPLNQVAYNQLARPSSYVAVRYYSQPKYNLFNDIVNKYMSQGGAM